MGEAAGDLGWPSAAIYSVEFDGRVELQILCNMYLVFKIGKAARELGWPTDDIISDEFDERIEL
jgi:hypothetical protein